MLGLVWFVPGSAHAQLEGDVDVPPVPSDLVVTDAWAAQQHEDCLVERADACAKLAVAFRLGRAGVAENLDLAVRLYARSWSLAPTRDAAVAIYEISGGAAVLGAEALAAMAVPCEQGSKNTCAAAVLHRLVHATSREQERQALAEMEQTCEAGADRACYDLSPLTGRLRDLYPWYFAD